MTMVDVSECTRDTSEDAATSTLLTLGMVQDGFVCPQEDTDWYSFDMPSTAKILSVKLAMTAAISPVAPTYTVWQRTDDGMAGGVLAQPPSTKIGAKLDDVHCVAPGSMYIEVRDDGDNSQDTRQRYELEVQVSPDPDSNEPNETKDAPSNLNAGQTVTGYIACAGDQDWYRIEVPDGNLMRLQLQSTEAPGYELGFRLFDTEDTLLVEERNLGGKANPTSIDRFVVLPGGGTYFIQVSDDDDKQANPLESYSLSVELIRDNDMNEPNNHPDEATSLTPGAARASCTNGQEFTVTGTIGSPGDNDWYAVDLDCMGGGILDAEVSFNTAGNSWEFNAQVQATVTLVRPHAPSTCDDDEQCTALNLPCESNNDCAGFFETCLPEGLCSGSTVCLPSNSCGANYIQRRYECRPILDECQPNQTPPPNEARLSAPVTGFPIAYLRVSDFQADGAAPDTTYTLTVRTRPEPDAAEPSNVVTNLLPTGGLQPGIHRGLARPVTVQPAGGCNANSGPWTEGYLSYENDLDWFKYDHPCPGEDCTMKMVFSTDAGPVDYVMNLYRGNRLWFTAFDNEERPMQAQIQGQLGGTSVGNGCFYAYQGHTSNDGPFTYYLVVRDLFDLYSDDATPIPSSRDFSGAQRYRFCVEKAADMCVEPVCKIYENGCGQPD